MVTRRDFLKTTGVVAFDGSVATNFGHAFGAGPNDDFGRGEQIVAGALAIESCL